MKVSELARTVGVTVATVKYYLREELMPAGTPVTATSSSYDESHVERVRLIRALVRSLGMSIADVRRVVDILEHPPGSWHDLLGSAQAALTPARKAPREHTPYADRLLRSQGWRVSAASPVRQDLERALEGARGAGLEIDDEQLDAYAEAAHAIAEVDLRAVPTTSPEAAVRQVVLGTVFLDPILAALRRLAQEDTSAQLFGRKGTAVRPARRRA